MVVGNGAKPGGERARDAGAPRDPPVRSPRTISRARPRVREHGTGRGMRRDDPTWRAQKTKKMTNTCFGVCRPHRSARSRCEDTTPPSSSPVPTIGGRLRRQRSFLDAKPGEKVDKTSRFPDPEFSRRAREGSAARVARRVDVRPDPTLREKSRLEQKYRGLTRGAGGHAAGRCAHQVSDPEGRHLAGLGGVRLRHRAPFGGSGGYAARRRRVRPAREIATCFFSPPTGKRGSLICLRAGVFVNERARPVDPKRGRYSEKGAELT